MIRLTRDEFLALFDASVHEALLRTAQQPGTTALVVFENPNLDSRELGERTAMAVGPERTYESVEVCEGRWLYDLPSQRQYAGAFILVEDLTTPDTPL